jgi:hypothetical protein
MFTVSLAPSPVSVKLLPPPVRLTAACAPAGEASAAHVSSSPSAAHSRRGLVPITRPIVHPTVAATLERCWSAPRMCAR